MTELKRLIPFVLLLATLSLSCSLVSRALNFNGATSTVGTPASARAVSTSTAASTSEAVLLPTQLPTYTAEPTTTTPPDGEIIAAVPTEPTGDKAITQVVRIGWGVPFYLRFNPLLWKVQWQDTGEGGIKVGQLVSQQNPQCVIKASLGHGVPQNLVGAEDQRAFGGQVYKISTYTDKTSGPVGMRIYRLAANEQIAIEPAFPQPPETCFQAVRPS